GTTPVSGLNVVLNYGSDLALVAVFSTDATGAFHFDSIPLDEFRLAARAPNFGNAGGLAFASGELASNGQVSTNTLVLDEDFPRVVAVRPLPTTNEVPITTTVELD